MAPEKEERVIELLERLVARTDISERFHANEKAMMRLEAEVRSSRVEQAARFDQHDRSISDLSDTVYGNGEDGLKTLVDRHNEDFKARMRERILVYGALVALVIDAIRRTFQAGP